MPTAVGFVVAGVVLGVAVDPVAGVLSAVVGLPVLALSAIQVDVTTERLVVYYSGRLRWPTTSIALGEIESVDVIDVEPLRYGGWGYRGSLRLFRRAAVTLRRGPGLRLGLTGGRLFVLTVDEPAGAAAALRRLPAGPSH